jgi:type II secretory pathway predicted ATPase ExeA
MNVELYRSVAERLIRENDELSQQQSDLAIAGLSSTDSVYFFSGAQRQHNLETLRHLSVFGDLILLLTGMTGAGKTTLLNRLTQDLGEGVQPITLVGQSTESLFDHVLLASDMLEQGVQTWEQWVFLLTQKAAADGSRRLVLLDDADACSENDLAGMVRAFQALPDSNHVVLLLTGSERLAQVIQNLVPQAEAEWSHQIQLRPLVESELYDYIAGAFKAVGYHEPLAINDTRIAELYRRSKGVFGVVDAYLASVLFGAELSKSEHKDVLIKTLLPQKVLFGIVAILLVSFFLVAQQHGLFSFSGEDEPVYSPITIVTHQKRDADNINVVEKKYVDAQREKRKAQIEQALAVSEGYKAPLSEQSSTPSVTEQKLISVALENTEVNELANREAVPQDNSRLAVDATDSRQESSPTSISSASVTNAKRISIKKTPRPEGYYRDQNWIRGLGRGNFTLQVLGSHNRETVLNYISRASNLSGELFFIESTYNDKPWFVVLYGSFSNRAEAALARENLPSYIAQQKPWIRPVSGLLRR